MSEASGELNSAPQNKDQLKSRLGKIAPAIKKAAGRVILASPLVAVLTSGDNPNVPAPNIKEQIPASATLPENTSHNTDILQPYTPQPSAETPTLTPTPDVSVPSIPEVPNIESPTAVPSPPSEQKTVENKELMPFTPSLTIIDVAPSTSNEEMIKNILGDKYISKSQLIAEFGQNYEEKSGEVLKKYPQAVLYYYFNYASHGSKVEEVVQKVVEKNGKKSTGETIIPIQKTLDSTSIKPAKDELGNEGFTLSFNQDKIIEPLKGGNNNIVNLSIQIGDVDLYVNKISKFVPDPDIPKPHFEDKDGKIFNPDKVYLSPGFTIDMPKGDVLVPFNAATGEEIKPISSQEYLELVKKSREEAEKKATLQEGDYSLKINGAYTAEKAEQNLPKLFKICETFPDKLFVVAAGNYREDLRGALEKLAANKPSNLLIIAEWGGGSRSDDPRDEGYPQGRVQGADLYVDNNELGIPEGSSFSTPVISAYASMLFDEGLSISEVKSQILKASDNKTYVTRISDITEDTHNLVNTVRVFNPSKLQEK